MNPVRGEMSFPTNEAEVAEYLRLADEEETGVVVTGAPGIEKTVPGDRERAFLSLSRMNAITRHDVEDLTLTCEPGVTIQEIQKAAGRHGQRAAIEVPDPETWTIGGVIGAREDGFLASAFGPVRDQILGLRVALASGEITKTGGKVVKNVTGYDLAKLYTGSRGTLGVITEVTIRLRSRAPFTRTFVFERPDIRSAAKDATRLRNLPCTVTALSIAGGHAVAQGLGPWLVSLRVEGRKDTLADAARLVREVAGVHHQMTEDDESDFWRATAAYPFTQPFAARLWLAPSKIASVVERLAIGDAPGRGFVIDWPAGRVAVSEAAAEGDIDQTLRDLPIGTVAEEFSAVAEILNDPLDWPSRTRRFGALPVAERTILRRLKESFDPGMILGSGRLFEEAE